MIQMQEAGSSRYGNYTHAEDEKIGKDAAWIGNNVVGACHDKDNIIESSKEMLDLPILKIPNKSKLLKLFAKRDEAILALQNNIDITLLEDSKRRWIFDSQNTMRQFYKTDVILMSLSLMKSSKELQQELTEEVQEM
nr:hypothetical protein [Tanacetum cinerariifolium]